MTSDRRIRLDYIDIAKGIGILLLIIGHRTEGTIHNYIDLFHMPLFFIISGINMKEVKGEYFDLKLVITYLINSILFIIFGFVNYGKDYSFSAFCQTINYTLSFDGINVLWFLTSLIFGKFFVRTTNNIKSKINQTIVVFALYSIGYVLSIYYLRIPFNYNILYLFGYSVIRSLNIVPFIFIGNKSKNIVKKYIENKETKKVGVCCYVLLCLSVLFLLADIMIIDYHQLCCGYYLINIIVGCVGASLVFVLSKVFRLLYKTKEVLIWCGKNSLPIMLTEYFKLSKYTYSVTKPFSLKLDSFLINFLSINVHVPIHLPIYVCLVYTMVRYLYPIINNVINTITNKLKKNKLFG